MAARCATDWSRHVRTGLRRWWAWLILALLVIGFVPPIVTVSRSPHGGSTDAEQGRIRLAVERRQWELADELLKDAARSRPLSTADRLIRAEVDRNLGREEEAIATLAAIPDNDALAPNARLLTARIERQRGRMRFAEAALKTALRLDPELIQARRELVYLYGMQARRDELNEQLRALSERTRLSDNELFVWTVSNVDIWINETIRGDLERYLAADPDDRHSRLALAQVLLRAGETDSAERVLGPLPRDDIEANVLRARVALDRSRLDHAEALLRDGPADHAGLARLRGQLAMRRGELEEAARQFRIAAKLDPTSLEVAQALALTLSRLGVTDQAEAAREHAGRLRTLSGLLERAHSASGRKDRALPRQIGAACEAIGRTAEALGWYQVAIDLDPLDAEAQRAVFRLRKNLPGTGHLSTPDGPGAASGEDPFARS
jgi:tetratricopeptide (TPR) repeat protein